jgi:hypothetical protein
MNLMALHFRIYLKNWQLLLFAFFPGVLLTAPALIAHYKVGQPHLMLTLLGTTGLVCSMAFFLGTAQQELLSRSHTFLLPGLRAGMARQILAVAGLVLVLAATSVFLGPAYQVPGHSLPSLAWSAGCAMVTVFSLLLLVLFASPYSSWLPFQAFWLSFLLIKAFMRVPPETVAGLVDHPVIWAMAAVLAGLAAWRRMDGAGLHRRLAEQPFISIVDLKNPGKIEAFKLARRKHKDQSEKSGRPGQALIRFGQNMTAQATVRGRHVQALVWESVTATALTGIPRNPLWVGLIAVFFLVLTVGTGYYDHHMSLRSDTDLVGWFPGFAFMFAYFSFNSFVHIKSRAAGLLRSRHVLYRAGLLSMAVNVATALVLSALVWGVFMVLHAVMPAASFRGELLTMNMPAEHTPFLPLFFAPLQFLVVVLWKNQRSVQIVNQAGMQAFFVFHAVLVFSKGAWLGYAVVAAAVLWVVLLLVWRWRALRSDLV